MLWSLAFAYAANSPCVPVFESVSIGQLDSQQNCAKCEEQRHDSSSSGSSINNTEDDEG